MTSDDTNHYDAQPLNPPLCLFQIGEALSALSIQNFDLHLHSNITHKMKLKELIVVVNVRNLSYLSVSPSILPIVAREALQ